MRLAWVVVVLLGACVASDAVPCGDGLVCAPGLQCAAVAGDTVCVTPAQLSDCAGVADLTACPLTDGEGASVMASCHEGVCLPTSCGNGRVDGGEACDDGNNTSGDGCAADCKSAEVCGNGVTDIARGETCDDGPAGRALSHDGCSSECIAEHPQWDVLGDPLGFWATSSFPAAAYDPRRNRLVMLGDHATLPVTVEWDGRHFTQASPTASPVPRESAGMTYDEEHHVLVLFGGAGFSDTWTWDGSIWTLVQAPTSPSPRSAFAMAYDPMGKRVVVFGGSTDLLGFGTPLDDTWTWDGATWTLLSVTGASPSPRGGMAMAYDPDRGVLLMFGGGTTAATSTDETWELSGTTWTQRHPAISPPGVNNHTFLVHDAATHRMLLVASPETWAWDGATWTRVSDTVPQSAALRFAVARASEGGEIDAFSSSGLVRWTGSGWTPVMSTTARFSPRYGHAGAADIAGRRVLVYGGVINDTTGAVGADTWLWNGGWVGVPAGGPGPLSGAAMAYDAHRGEFVMFGGSNGANDTGRTWVFEAGAWTERMVATAPSARSVAAMTYDAARQRVVLFGGLDATGNLADTWLWDGTAWMRASPATAPVARSSAAMTYDPIAKEVILFGGITTGFADLGDTWAWDGTAWHQRAVSGPGARDAAAIAWDGARQRVMLYGGGAGNVFNDVWELDGTTWHELSPAVPLPRRAGHIMVSSLDSAGVLSIGGTDTRTAKLFDDVAWLHWLGGTHDESTPFLDLDGDGLGTGGCAAADPDLWPLCTPECPPGTSCPPTAPRCGDATCDTARESCVLCPEDCGAC